jgi:uncharacterized membrane protein
MARNRLNDSRVRHLIKTITWRAIASLITFGLAWVFFREDPFAASKAAGVALTETVVKMLLYYLHERAWFRVEINLKNSESNGDG